MDVCYLSFNIRKHNVCQECLDETETSENIKSVSFDSNMKEFICYFVSQCYTGLTVHSVK